MRLTGRVGWLGCLFTLAILLCTGPILAQKQATVKVRDGRTVTGNLLEEDNKTVTLEISGIRTPIPRDQIESIEYLASPEEEYAQRRAKLAENDLEGRYGLALWLYQHEAYELAQKELDDLAQRFPDDSRVTVLRNAVAGRIKLMQEQATATPPPDRPTPPPPPTVRDPMVPPPGLPDEKLTQEQINVLKLYEVDLSARPSVIVPRDVIDDLLEKYRNNDLVPKGRTEQSAFRSAKGYEQLETIFALRAREYYPKITVRTDPPALHRFRTEIHQSYILPYCAANGCHGDASGGNLFLFRTSPNSDPTVYTNFFILHRYQTAKSYMIDREMPDSSLLLQYGMARDLAKTPHPEVPGYAPQIRQGNDQRIETITRFIGELYRPAPSYGISYIPPTPGKKTEAPADTPAPGSAPTPGSAPAPAPAPKP